jgi:hypothetical protein
VLLFGFITGRSAWITTAKSVMIFLLGAGRIEYEVDEWDETPMKRKGQGTFAA